jgi:hypothetical protein
LPSADATLRLLREAEIECSARMSALEGNVLQNSSLRRESAIIESRACGTWLFLVIVAPLPAFAVEAGAWPDHPIIGS